MQLQSGKAKLVKVRLEKEIAIPKPSLEDVTGIIVREARRYTAGLKELRRPGTKTVFRTRFLETVVV